MTFTEIIGPAHSAVKVVEGLEPIRVSAVKIEQNGKILYAAKVSARQLNQLGSVDTRSYENPDGYQREKDKARCKRIAHYVSDAKGLLPTSVLLSLRQKASFTPLSDGAGVLEIPNEPGAVWVVDGQHRLGGLKETEADIELPAVFIPDMDRLEEMRQFYVINKTQKPINSSLTLDIQARIGDSGDWRNRAYALVSRLNKDGDSPWYGKINLIGRRKAGLTVTLTSFVTALKLLVRDTWFGALDLEEQLVLLKRYWEATKMFMDAWAFPKEHFLLKTMGVYALSQVALYVFHLCRDGNQYTVEKFRECLSPIKQMDWSNTTAAASYGGMKGYKRLAEEIKLKLEPMRLGPSVNA